MRDGEDVDLGRDGVAIEGISVNPSRSYYGQAGGGMGVSANRREKRRRVRVRTVRRGRIDGRRDAWEGAGRGDGQSPVNADEISHIGPL